MLVELEKGWYRIIDIQFFIGFQLLNGLVVYEIATKEIWKLEDFREFRKLLGLSENKTKSCQKLQRSQYNIAVRKNKRRQTD